MSRRRKPRQRRLPGRRMASPVGEARPAPLFSSSSFENRTVVDVELPRDTWRGNPPSVLLTAGALSNARTTPGRLRESREERTDGPAGHLLQGNQAESGESMNEYITRKKEAYMQASPSMKRVQPHYEAGGTRPPSSSWTAERRSSGDSYSQGWSRQWTPAIETGPGLRHQRG